MNPSIEPNPESLGQLFAQWEERSDQRMLHTLAKMHLTQHPELAGTLEGLPQREPTRLHLIFPVLDTPLVRKAREQAHEDFKEKTRKVPSDSDLTPKPYAHHLEMVACILAEEGYSENVVIAGYLHDHLEDLPDKYAYIDIAREFGPTVATLVDWVTQQDKSLSWEERNANYLLRLSQAPREAIAISAADKLANISDTIPILKMGYPITSILKRDGETNLKKFRELLPIFKENIAPRFYDRVHEAVEEFARLIRNSDQ